MRALARATIRRMAKVFLSHSSGDQDEVRRLAIDLRELGIEVWLDEWEIGVGDSISQRIEQGLRDSHFLAVWLTRAAVASGWVEHRNRRREPYCLLAERRLELADENATGSRRSRSRSLAVRSLASSRSGLLNCASLQTTFFLSSISERSPS